MSQSFLFSVGRSVGRSSFPIGALVFFFAYFQSGSGFLFIVPVNKVPYEPVWPLLGWSVGRSFRWLVSRLVDLSVCLSSFPIGALVFSCLIFDQILYSCSLSLLIFSYFVKFPFHSLKRSLLSDYLFKKKTRLLAVLFIL